jgi:hypothetical protein
MKYFTPELYIQGNSPDEDVVDRAVEEWERANKRYLRRYKKIKGLLPESFCKFHDECCLHDADVFGPAWLSMQTLPWGFRDLVIVAQNVNTLFAEHLNTLMFLQYALSAEPVIERPGPETFFHKGQAIWLYDEVDVLEPGVFLHEIFIRDGRVVKLRFRDFRYHIGLAEGDAENDDFRLR